MGTPEEQALILEREKAVRKIVEEYIKNATAAAQHKKKFETQVQTILEGQKGKDLEGTIPARPVVAPAPPAEESPLYRAGVQSTALTSMGRISPKDLEIDLFADQATQIVDGNKFVIEKFKELNLTLTAGAYKLLRSVMQEFTRVNHISPKNKYVKTPPKIQTKLSIPVKEHAGQCNPKTIERAKGTPLAQAKEHERAENALHNERKKIGKALNYLSNIWLTFPANESPDEIPLSTRIVITKKLKDNYIYVELAPDVAKHLAARPITYYSTAIMAIDERNPNAIRIAAKIEEHYFMDSNQLGGTAERLRVKTLLGVTDLPKYESTAVKQKGWRPRILEPFQNCMDVLTREHPETHLKFLADWYYCRSKGERITDAEMDDIITSGNYQEWEDLQIQYVLKDPPPEVEIRLVENRQKAKTKAENPRPKTRRKRKAKAKGKPVKK